MERVVLEYSYWYIPLCLAGGIIYALILYYREKQNEFSLPEKWIMVGFRVVSVSTIAFLLLNPLIRSVSKTSEKPVILVVQDNTKSILSGTDSLYYLNEYQNKLDNLSNEISKDFKINKYLFGKDLKDWSEIDFSESQTNVANALQSIYDRYSHRNVGACIFLSDGINNMGINPLYSGIEFDFPVYTVALGDTSIRKDLILSKIYYNQIAYANNEFPVEIDISALKCKGLNSILTIEKNGIELFRKNIYFNSENDYQSVRIALKAEESGLQRFTAILSRVADEISYVNNTRDFYIDILEGKQKILLLANAPHPDISALKQSISNNINYELESFIISDFTNSVKGYNLIILHGLPSVKHNISSILEQIKSDGIPVLFFLTGDTFLPLFNEQQTGLLVSPQNLIYNEALPIINKNFSAFSLNEKTLASILLFPPLISPYGNIQVSPSAQPLMFQKISSVGTGLPLLLFNQTIESKSGVILGSGIWKWRLKDFVTSESHTSFDDIINKTVQYLSVKIDKSLFRVYSNNNFEESDDVEFEAEVYNEIYELINDEEVSILISGPDETNYPFSFSKTSNAYYLNAGSLPPGNYSYSARVKSGINELTERGVFSISSKKLEKINTIADHSFLYNISQKYGGEMIYPDQLESIPGILKERTDIKTISFTQKTFSEILNLPILLVLILVLLSIEWFIRKRAGGY